MSNITQAIIGRSVNEALVLSDKDRKILEALDPSALTESKKAHIIHLLQLARNMDSVNSIKALVRAVLKQVAPESVPTPPMRKDREGAPEPPAKRAAAPKVPTPTANAASAAPAA